jgi:outer membrane protein
VIYGRKSYCSIKQSNNVITAENTLLISKLSLAQLLQLKDFESFDVVDNIKDENNIMANLNNYEKPKRGEQN